MYYCDGWKLHRWWFGGLRIEFAPWSRSFGLEIDVEGSGSDHNLLFSIRPYIFSLYFGFSGRRLGRLCNRLLKGSYEGRTVGIRVFDWAIWWECWAPNMSWSSGEPWWMRWTWHPLDTIFGRHQHSERLVSRQKAWVPMPEKAYRCVVEMKDETWKRPRLPWPSRQLRRAHIECEEGVPFPGKGENSWDCGDDASYSLTTPARTVEEGIAKYVESVLGNRRNRGSPMKWQRTETHEHG